jgi:hypothetical protein
MLASITPLGERGRRSRWSVTVSAFALGAALTGVVTGAALGALGGLIVGDALGSRARLAVLGVALAAAVLLELLPGRMPGPRRQVNERWLDEYRGWVYGLGFGAQLGFGLSTVVSSAATYVAIIAALLTGDPGRGALVLGCYGAVRGLTPLLGARIRRPDQLLALHGRLERWRGPITRLTPMLLVVLLALALVGAA